MDWMGGGWEKRKGWELMRKSATKYRARKTIKADGMERVEGGHLPNFAFYFLLNNT